MTVVQGKPYLSLAFFQFSKITFDTSFTKTTPANSYDVRLPVFQLRQSV